MKKNSRKLFKKYENNIVDIFLFGSYIKNKSKPEDIDICIVLKDSDYNLPEKIYPDFKKLFDGAHYNWILINELFEISLFSTLIEEGYSLLNDYYLSEKLDHNYTYLANLFSEVQGTTIEHFIISHKTERIKELIIYGELNITEIAWKMGYSSVAHLSTQFKKVTGLSPSHFKQLKDKRRSPIEDIGNQSL